MKKQVKAWAIDQWGKKPLIIFTEEIETHKFTGRNPSVSHQVLKGHFVYHVKRKRKAVKENKDEKRILESNY